MKTYLVVALTLLFCTPSRGQDNMPSGLVDQPCSQARQTIINLPGTDPTFQQYDYDHNTPINYTDATHGMWLVKSHAPAVAQPVGASVTLNIHPVMKNLQYEECTAAMAWVTSVHPDSTFQHYDVDNNNQRIEYVEDTHGPWLVLSHTPNTGQPIEDIVRLYIRDPGGGAWVWILALLGLAFLAGVMVVMFRRMPR